MSWEIKKVSDLGRIVTGKTPSTKNRAFYDGEYPFVTPTDLDWQSYYVRNTHSSVTMLARERHANQFIPEGSTTFTCIGNTIGKCGLTSKDSLTNQQINSIVTNDEHDDLFVYYLLNFNREKVRSIGLGGGAAQPIINKTTFSNIKIQCPDLSTQKRIARVLSAYDDLIETNQRRIALLEEAARLIYREWFVHFRFPNHENAKFEDGLPEGWEKVRLEEVCNRITDGSHSSPKSVEDGFPMASVKDMHSWGFNLEVCRSIGHDDFDKLVRNDCKPLIGDVLIAKDGSYLKHSFVIQEAMEMVILSSIAILRPNERIDSHYLNFILRDPQTKEAMKGYVSGAALPRIILKEFRNFKVVLPSAEVQAQWCEKVHPIVKQCASLVNQNQALTKARDLLLPRLMNGRIAV